MDKDTIASIVANSLFDVTKNNIESGILLMTNEDIRAFIDMVSNEIHEKIDEYMNEIHTGFKYKPDEKRETITSTDAFIEPIFHDIGFDDFVKPDDFFKPDDDLIKSVNDSIKPFDEIIGPIDFAESIRDQEAHIDSLKLEYDSLTTYAKENPNCDSINDIAERINNIVDELGMYNITMPHYGLGLPAPERKTEEKKEMVVNKDRIDMVNNYKDVIF